MKRILVTILIIHFPIVIAQAQSGWVPQISGSPYNLWDIKFINSMTGLASGEYGTITKTTNGGVNWIVHWISNTNTVISISLPTDNVWYAGDNESQIGRVFKSTNAGLSWDTTYTHQGSITKIDFVNAFTGFAICKYNYFIKTIDGGNNWKDTNMHISQNWAMDFVDANTGIIGSSVGTYRTTNGGSNWVTVGNSIAPLAFGIQFVNSNIVYGCNSRLYKSTDGGITWQQLSVSGQTGNVWQICFLNPDSGYVICNAIYRTTNGGISFDSISSYVPEYSYYFTDMMTGYGAGSNGTIIKTTTGGEPIGIQPISNEVPTRFALHQNYPNPFNPTTKIKFDVPLSKGGYRGLSIQLFIYDITGREVATLLNEQLQAGTYEIEWDASNFASGVYFYQLVSGDFIQTKKLVLLK